MSESQQHSDLAAQIHQRREKLDQLRKEGIAFPNDFLGNQQSQSLHERYDALDNEALLEDKVSVKVAGRIMLQRVMGKASFASIQDMSGTIQLYVRRDDLPEGQYAVFKSWDLGDIIAAEGFLFKTKTGELSVHVESIRLLTKCLRPLPDKFHGLADRELRYRQRYLDLIVNPQVRQTFILRSRIIDSIREFLKKRGFLEVETPMMQAIPGGAAARPFETHHNALDMPLFLRIAPELYLKRLVVGGFEKVFEVNRNFRNEGVSARHNPEFTMLEFYQAYADYKTLLTLTEALFKEVCVSVLGTTVVDYQEETFDFAKPFAKLTLAESLCQYNEDVTEVMLSDADALKRFAEQLDIHLEDGWGIGKLQLEIFDKTVEHQLRQPTFITAYPTEVSPLARQSDSNPDVTERFELFIAGREIANGFSELNDPDEQAKRFKQQAAAKQAGDVEAMFYDEDYVTALEYGLPPTAGEGIGIDRLVMLLTNQASIRDVLLFPHLRAKSGDSGQS